MKKKILTLMFEHETNSFSPYNANMQSYKNQMFFVGEEVFSNLRGLEIEFGGFLNVFQNREDIELIPTVALSATPCGPVTEDVYNFVLEKVREAILNNSPLDGVLIQFHGAMVAQNHSDAEGDLLEFIRQLVGNDIPIVSSLDLHANVTRKMADMATALIPYETYPHIDCYSTGLFAARIMEDILDGKLHPVMEYRRVPYLLPLLPTDSEQLQPLYQTARELQKQSEVLSVRFSHGFFAGDIEEMGMAVMVVTNNDRLLASNIADIMKKAIEDNISKLKQNYCSLDEALDEAELDGDGPVVLADASDNPGAGGLNDSTHILRRILERGIKGAAVATILDPESVEKCVQAGAGATLKLNLGGKSDAEYSGGPLPVTAYVKMISDGKYIFKGNILRGLTANHGTTVVAEIEGNIVLITSLPRQPYDLEIFRSHGIVPEHKKILVVKSSVHYRASYGTVARKMFTLALPGYSVPIPEGYTYKNWKGKITT